MREDADDARKILRGVTVTYFVYRLRCLLVAAHEALRLPLCGWQLVERPASAASLPDPVALQVALVPVQQPVNVDDILRQTVATLRGPPSLCHIIACLQLLSAVRQAKVQTARCKYTETLHCWD